MKYVMFVLFFVLFIGPTNAQEVLRNQDVNLEWIDDYYAGDTILRLRMQQFYKELENTSTAFDTELLFYELRDLSEALTYGIQLDETDDYESFENEMHEAIKIMSSFDLPGFVFSCAAECTMFYVSPNFQPLIDAALKTQDPQDDIALKIITDTWGVVENESPSFQTVECCACPGSNNLGNGEQHALVTRINDFIDNYNLFADELESIKATIKNYIINNDGFTMDEASVLQEFDLIQNELNFNDEELSMLKEKDLFKKIGLNYTIQKNQFYVKGTPVSPGCIAQLKTELNGDNSQAVIYLDRTSLRGCLNANITFPGGHEQDISYSINASLGNDMFKITVNEAVDGSLGGYSDKIVVQFVNRIYLLKDGSEIVVLSLSKVGDW
ncbi:MAG: hypothetical protein P8M87_03605 [Crocinitomicaceae bacterium]|nr:hypothetical protein [Crocinitomicaceae bacterium]MDG2505220.1 hypothetical protein [Crocinitomicaceae bacterium]